MLLRSVQTDSRGFFLGRLRGGSYVGDFTMEEFHMGEENFHEGGAGFSSII